MKYKNVNEEDLWCNYSDLPSPKAYVDCADYDSMGNHGRFPKNKMKMKKLNIKKIIFFIDILLKKFKKKRKTIWEL